MTTYAQLKTDVDNWLARDDVAVTGPDVNSITRLAEAEIGRDIRSLRQQQRTTLTTSTGPDRRFLDLPADFLELSQIFIDTTNGRRGLEYQTPEVIRKQKTWNSNNATVNNGQIGYYSIEGDDVSNQPADTARLVLAPEPSDQDTTDIEIYYFARWPALVDDTDTNWLLQNYYDIYLWQLLKQACIYTQETELIAQYDTLYQGAREAFNRQANRARFRGSAKVSYNNPRMII